MNTAPFLLSQVLQVCRGNGSLHTQAHIHDPVLGNHGDLCVLGGFKADSLATTAENHDPQHKPYGICWSMAQGSATPKIPTKAAPHAAPYATFGSPYMQRFVAKNRDDKNIGYFKAPIDPKLAAKVIQIEREELAALHKEAAASYRPPPRIPLPSGLGYGPVSKGYATEQPLQAPPTPAPTREPPMPPAVGVTRRPQSWTPAVAAPAVADAAPQTTAATEPAPKWSEASDAETWKSLAEEPDDDDDDHQPPMPWDRQRAASSAGYATEQPLQEHTPIDTRRQLYPRLSDQQKEWIRELGPPSAAKSDGAAMAAMKMPLRSAVAENFQRASDEETAAAAAAAATEHSEDASTPELASQELPGFISTNPAAGRALEAAPPLPLADQQTLYLRDEEAPSVRKQRIGEQLFTKVNLLQPGVANRICGMLLEREDKRIIALLNSDDELKLQVDKARAILDEETNPLTKGQLAAAPTDQQKRMIGEKLYIKIAKLGIDNPNTVTGIILRLQNDVLMSLLPEQAKEHLRKHVAVAERMISSSPETWPIVFGDRDYKAKPGSTAAATQLSADGSTPELASQEVPADKMMIYSIVNEFLGKITFNDSAAEEMLIAALMHKTCLSPAVHLRVETVFSRVFFYYANGVNDRSGWQPRDTSKYIRQWSELATMRTWVSSGFAASTEHSEQLTKDQVSQIFKLYMEDMKSTLREEQLDKPWVYYKSCAEAKLRHQAGDKFVAKAIWAIGLPRLPSFATEQRGKPLSAQDLEAVPEAIDSVLNWLDRLASTLTAHHETNQYKTAVRKSGVAHRQSGLNATEQKTRRATRKANCDIQSARDLDRRWINGTLTFQNWDPRQEALLRAYWNGSLQGRLKEAKNSRGSADPMCRTPLQPLRL